MMISSPSSNVQPHQSNNLISPIIKQDVHFFVGKKLPIPFISINSKPITTELHNTQEETANKEPKNDQSSEMIRSNNFTGDNLIQLNDYSIDTKDESNEETSTDKQDLNPINNTQISSIERKKSNRKTRVPFTPEEDEKIKQLVNLYGNKHWSVIASFLVKRTPKQCRDRYTNYLIPGLFKGEWSNEEDDLLKRLYEQNGPRWSVFKNHFPGRSANSIKNRWNYFLSRQERTTPDENCGFTQFIVESKNNLSNVTHNDDVLNTLYYQSCEMINNGDVKEDSPEVTNLLENEMLETDNIIDFSHDWYVF